MSRMPLAERVQRRSASQPDGFVLWTGFINRDGYGTIKIGNSTRSAHRVSYELAVGEIPFGLELDHLCRTRSCVNPAHLEPVTHAENVRRSDVALGRHSAATHCKSGHEFTEANTYWRPNGHRQCRRCNAIAAQGYKERAA